MVVGEQVAHRRECVPRPVDHIEQHRVVHGELGGQRLGFGRDEPFERRQAVPDAALGGFLADHLAPLLRIVPGLRQRAFVLDHMLGGLHDDVADRVVAGPPGDLVELPRRQQPHPAPVVLRQGGEHHRADRHIDPHPQGVRAADDLQQPRLGELLHQPAVLWQHPGVMHPDAVADQPGQHLAEPGGEPEVPDRPRDRVLLRPGRHVHAHQRLRPFQRLRLGEVHDVDGGLVGLQQLTDRLVHRRGDEPVEQRHRTLRGAHHRGAAPGPPRTATRRRASPTSG